MHELGIEMELLWLTRDGPPPIMCSPFRLGQPPETYLRHGTRLGTLLLLFGNRESSSRDQLRMREFGIEMELLCLARDGPPPIMCSTFRLGLRNETFSWSLQFSRVSMVQGLSSVFAKLSRVLTSQFTAVYCYAGCQAA